jgi:Domain of unknown function (DUF222)
VAAAYGVRAGVRAVGGAARAAPWEARPAPLSPSLPNAVTLARRSVPSLAERRHDHAPSPTPVPVLAQVDALPRPERESAVRDREHERAVGERGLQVGGHVVGALHGVGEVLRAVRHGPVEPGRKVAPDVRARVLVQRERRGRVLHEDGGNPHAKLSELRHRPDDLIGHEMEATRPRPERDLPLDPHVQAFWRSTVPRDRLVPSGPRGNVCSDTRRDGGRDANGTRISETQRLEREIGELAARIHAATCRWLLLVAKYNRREGWKEWGAVSCGQWLSWRCGIAPRAAREQVRVARRLTELPLAREAFSRGELSYSKARALCRIATPRTERELVETALHVSAAQLERLVRTYRGVVSTQIEQAYLSYDRRYVDWEWDEDGSLVVRVRLPVEDGALLIRWRRRATTCMSADGRRNRPLRKRNRLHAGDHQAAAGRARFRRTAGAGLAHAAR